LKGIKREFSVPRTPQQNGIVERKNRTLIEAAKTLVLVTKPHNKTPYELLHGRLSSIGFMRPFGCHVTILNTLDPLGKFQGKVDEGFLVGYSVCSKEFRVFNSRTRIIQETLHVNFMENKPNVAGSGPAWLFDIDSLSQTMNYHPVIAENQTNSNAGFQDTKKAWEEGTQTYMLFPVLSDGSTNSQNNNKDALVDGKEHDDDIQKSVSPDIHSLSSGAQTRKQGDKTENKDKGKNHVVTIIGFRDLNAEFEECNINSSNGVNSASSLVSTAGQNSINNTNDFSAAGPSNAAMPNLEDLSHSNDADDVGAEADINNLESIISNNNTDALVDVKEHDDNIQKSVSLDIHFLSSGAQLRKQGDKTENKDKDDVGAEADINNLESIISVSPILTTRIHKDHPTSQIIGDLSLTTQTRSMARAVRDQGRISQMFNEDFHTCMFTCFLSQKEPKRVHQALKDPSWIEAMQEELLQFKMQKVWILVDLPYGKSAIGTKWVYRNKKDEKSIVIKNKARLVSQGHTQEEGIDYKEVFAPVARIKAIRLFLAYASFMVFPVYQMDVKSAFFYGTVEEEAYICQPLGFEDLENPKKVYKVVKAHYGLHQAPRAWYETLATYLLENGFQRGTIEQTLFIKKQQKDILLVQIYVDDIIFGATNKALCQSFEKLMNDKFQMSSMGELTFFLGIHVKQKKDGIFISQDKYVAEILKKFGLSEGKSASTSIDAERPLLKDSDGEDVDVYTYSDSPLLGVNTPRSDEDRLKLMELMVFLLQKGFWNTASVKRSGDVTRLQALVDKKKIVIFEVVIREILQLDDAEGVVCFPNEEIFAGLAQMGYEKPMAMASAVICLSKGQKFNFSKYIFDSLVRNVDSSSKFYMYPRFIQLIIQNQVGDLSTHTIRFISPFLTQKVFANMRRVGKVFSGVVTPLFEGMLAVRQPAEEGLVDEQVQVDDAVEENVAEDGAKFPPQLQQVLNVCSALTKRVENLKNDNAAQKLVIIKLKARVKRLEKANMVKSLKLRRLRKVGASKQVESFDDIEDVFNQGRMIDDMDKDEGIELEDDSKVQEVVEVVTTAKLIIEVVTAAASQVSAASATIPTAKPSIPIAAPTVVVAYTRRRKGVIIRDPEEELSSKTPTETPKVKDKGKEINRDEFNKDIDWDAAMDHVNQKSNNPQYINRYQGIKKRPLTESEARKNMMIYLKNTDGYKMDFFKEITYQGIKKRPLTESEARKNMMIYLKNTDGYKMDFFKEITYAQICPIFQARFDENMRFLLKSREEMEEEDQEIIKSINETPAQKATKRRKLSEEAQEAEDLRKRLEIVLIDNKPRFKIIKADETHQLYISFTTLLKNFDREHLENLWRIVKDRFSTSKPTNFSDEYLLLTLKTMFEEPDGQDAIWRNQKSVHGLALVKRLQISQNPRGIFINQSKYALESLKKYGFESWDPVDTPIVEKSKLDEDKEGKSVDPSHYHGTIGTLLYLTASRHGLQFAICMCAQYQARPIEKHVHAVKKIFRYLRGTVNQGLRYSKDSSVALTTFVDADQAGCQDTRRSTSGSVQFLGERLIRWSSKR
nr:putative ribonuclease H-like domain-containing protein [Tanacetum cinerariifolium]